MEITLELIRKIAKDIVDGQIDDIDFVDFQRGERMALRMLIRTLEDMQIKTMFASKKS